MQRLSERDRTFYRRVLAVTLPIIVQNGITNFVSLLDNVMVGQVGTVQMSGVAIVNQLIFVFNLCVFGATSGAGIFTSQFHGSGDTQGVRQTFRFKIILGLLLTALGVGVYLAGGEKLIGHFLSAGNAPEDAAATMAYGMEYMHVMLLGLLPFALANAYSGTLRETGQTMVPMAAGVVAVAVNFVLNYMLIFGHFGAPQMGVTGAAVATVVSRYVELAVVCIWTHRHAKQNPFIQGAYRSFRISGDLTRHIICKGMPLLANEALWSVGMTMLNQCYSTRGLEVVAAVNISNTIYQLSSVVYMSMGNSVGIIMGQMLGANTPEQEVRDSNKKMIRLSVLSCLLFGGILAALSGVFPQIYNTSDSVRSLSAQLICISALIMPFSAYTHAAYFTLRSGGQTFVTFLFDSVFVWVCLVPLAFILSRFTNLPIVPMFFICQGTEVIKSYIGSRMLKKGIWIRRIVH